MIQIHLNCTKLTTQFCFSKLCGKEKEAFVLLVIRGQSIINIILKLIFQGKKRSLSAADSR